MKLRITSFLLVALLAAAIAADSSAQSTAFTYQGRLNQNGAPAQGVYDLRFTTHDLPTGGSALLNPITNSVVGVTNGLFTVLLDFGSDTFTGADRWLDIAVRPAGNGAFTPLTPRQPITPTPYALTALTAKQVPGVSGNALHAADGSPQNAVFVDDAGNVGVGTTSPVSKLHVTSAPGDAAPPRLQSSGGSTFNAGLDFYPGGIGRGYVGVPDFSASFAAGEMLVYSGPGVKTTLWSGGDRSLTADTDGNVGIGTDIPAAKLEVRGDIRLGPTGQLRAASSEENLRLVRGFIGGGGDILIGSGFQVSHPARGEFSITFNTPFAGRPVVTATCVAEVNDALVTVKDVTGVSANFLVRWAENQDHTLDDGFNFIAIGPR